MIKRSAIIIAILLMTITSGNAARVCSKSGKCISVAPSAQGKLQCVVNYVESAGVRIAAMRGYGRGTVRASLHPSGRAMDINQTARDVTRPRVPRSVSNAAARECGVVTGNSWCNRDNGHWQVGGHDGCHRRHYAQRASGKRKTRRVRRARVNQTTTVSAKRLQQRQRIAAKPSNF